MKLNFPLFIILIELSAAVTLAVASQEEQQSLRGSSSSAAATDDDRHRSLSTECLFKNCPEAYDDVVEYHTYVVECSNLDKLKEQIDKTEKGFLVFAHEEAKIAVIAGLTNEDIETRIKSISSVENVQPDSEYDLEDDGDVQDANSLMQVDNAFIADNAADVQANNAANAADPPTDAYFFNRQWNMNAIKADEGWAAGKMGSEDITIAILDTGIDYLYPDLVGRVDLDRSMSFINRDDYLRAHYFPDRHNITDLHYHGTHVAATAVSNGKIVAGVTKKTRLIGVKVCNVFGQCPFSSVIRGLLYAADNRADVANLSLGGVFSKKGHKELIKVLKNAIKYVAEKRGMTVVVSAGNSNLSLEDSDMKTLCSTSGTDKDVICVSATAPDVAGPWTDLQEVPAAYTNYGNKFIDVAAPGGDSTGKILSACSTSSLVIPICRDGTYALNLAGTSMSAPHVSGLSALVAEDTKMKGKPKKIKKKIEDTADKMGQNPGDDEYFGDGRVNVARALGLVVDEVDNNNSGEDEEVDI